jgi:large subunit ribosomal protein L22
MTAAKTNESPVVAHKSADHGPSGDQVRAVAKYVRTSPYKMRVVLNLVRGQKVADAADILRLCERDAAITIGKVLRSAVANAVNNDGIPAEELYVSSCYADEGPTIKRFRPRARGRTGQILKRTSHVTVLVSRLPDSLIGEARSKGVAAAEQRARRTSGNRAQAEAAAADTRRDASGTTETIAGATIEAPAEVVSTEVVGTEVVETAVLTTEVQELVAAEVAETEVAETEVVETEVAETTEVFQQIIGIGPALEAELNAAGISTIAELAALSDEEIVALDAKVTRSADQITDWRTQAQQLLGGSSDDTSTKNT